MYPSTSCIWSWEETFSNIYGNSHFVHAVAYVLGNITSRIRVIHDICKVDLGPWCNPVVWLSSCYLCCIQAWRKCTTSSRACDMSAVSSSVVAVVTTRNVCCGKLDRTLFFEVKMLTIHHSTSSFSGMPTYFQHHTSFFQV